MKQFTIILFTLLACVMGACSSDDDAIIKDEAKNPLNAPDCYQTVHVGDEVTVKSLCGSQLIFVSPTYKKSDSAKPTPISGTIYKGVLHHWLEANQTGDSTIVFKVHAPEASDTVTYMDAYINSTPPYVGEGIVTFRLVPLDSKGISGYSDSFRSE